MNGIRHMFEWDDWTVDENLKTGDWKRITTDQHSKNHKIYIRILKLLYKVYVKCIKITKNGTPC